MKTIRQTLFSEAGFSLFEILIATGLFAIAAVVVAQGVLFSTDIKIRDKNLLKASFLANRKMVEVESTIYDDMERGIFPDDKTERGEFEDEDQGFTWEYQIKKIEIPVQKTEENNVIAVAALKRVFDEISKSVRELSVTIFWIEDADKEEPEQMRLVTHVVKIK